MSNFWTDDTKNLKFTVSNPKPMDIPVSLTIKFVDTTGKAVLTSPSQIVTVPANGGKDFTIPVPFAGLAEGTYIPVIEMTDPVTGALIGRATGENTNIYSKVLSVVNVTWVKE